MRSELVANFPSDEVLTSIAAANIESNTRSLSLEPTSDRELPLLYIHPIYVDDTSCNASLVVDDSMAPSSDLLYLLWSKRVPTYNTPPRLRWSIEG